MTWILQGHYAWPTYIRIFEAWNRAVHKLLLADYNPPSRRSLKWLFRGGSGEKRVAAISFRPGNSRGSLAYFILDQTFQESKGNIWCTGSNLLQ